MHSDRERGSAEIALWRRLVARAWRSGLGLEDAQDLAGRAVLQALESFDPGRGAFAPLCVTIHRNLMRNHFRDRKIAVPFDPDRDERTAPEDPLEILGEEEWRAMMSDLAESILAELDPDEAEFYRALGEVMAEMEAGAVSEAARRCGIPPAKGWDIFRRIRRKARKHARRFEALRGTEAPPSVESPAEPLAQCLASAIEAESASPGSSVPLDLEILAAVSESALLGFDRFSASLSTAQRARLAACLS